jgi:hypothetical protein
MVPATSCMASVPVSRRSTSRASQKAKRMAASPATGMTQTIAVAISISVILL